MNNMKYYDMMDLLDTIALQNRKPTIEELKILDQYKAELNTTINDIAEANDCWTSNWFDLVAQLAALHRNGERVPMHKIKYVLHEKLECGCNSGTVDYFYYKLKSLASERIEIMNAIDKFIWRDEESIKKFICFDCKLEDVAELSQVHLMTHFMDKSYNGDCFVAMLDEVGNPSLYRIEQRYSDCWKKDTDGDEYYVSPKTGHVYMFYQMRGNNSVAITDMICCMEEYSSEENFLDINRDEEIVPARFVSLDYAGDNKINHEFFEKEIEIYEKEM